jgi:predicted nucleotidyltransferase
MMYFEKDDVLHLAISNEPYRPLLRSLLNQYGNRLKTVVLFGSQARREARPGSDHDIFVVIEGLPFEPLARQRDVRGVLLPILDELPGSISFVSKTPEEVENSLTPLMLDICVDGICLYGNSFFDEYRQKALAALKQAGWQRRRLAGTWMWVFSRIPAGNWDLSWGGYRERAG